MSGSFAKNQIAIDAKIEPNPAARQMLLNARKYTVDMFSAL